MAKKRLKVEFKLKFNLSLLDIAACLYKARGEFVREYDYGEREEGSERSITKRYAEKLDLETATRVVKKAIRVYGLSLCRNQFKWYAPSRMKTILKETATRVFGDVAK